MKNVFGYDVIEKTWDGEPFIVKKAPAPLGENARAVEKQSQAGAHVSNRYKLLIAGTWSVFLVGCILSFVFARIAKGIEFSEALKKAGWCLYIALPCLVFGGIGAVIQYAQIKNSVGASRRYSAKMDLEQENVSKQIKKCYAALGVPSDAKQIDVVKSGSEDDYKEYNAMNYNEFYAVMAYRERDALNFACTDCVFSIPLSRIERIQCINKRVWAYGWNKTEPWNSVAFGAYGLKKKFDSRAYSTQFYYKLVCRGENGEEYCVLVPAYDAETVLALTGKTVE